MLPRRGLENRGEGEGGVKSEQDKWGTFTASKHLHTVRDYTFPKLWIRANSPSGPWLSAGLWLQTAVRLFSGSLEHSSSLS